MSKVYSVSITCFLKCSVLIFFGGRKNSKEDNEDGEEDDEDRAGTKATEGEDFVVRQHAKVAELNIASGKLMLMLKLMSLLMLILMLMLMLMSMLMLMLMAALNIAPGKPMIKSRSDWPIKKKLQKKEECLTISILAFSE